MSLEELKRLRSHIEVAIRMVEVGGLKDMSEVEKREFKARFGDADMVLGDFIIRMTKPRNRHD